MKAVKFNVLSKGEQKRDPNWKCKFVVIFVWKLIQFSVYVYMGGMERWNQVNLRKVTQINVRLPRR